jgi:hypothetical protein
MNAVVELQNRLRPLKTRERVAWLSENLVTPPLEHSVAESRAGSTVERFHVLQGDIIRTSAAFELGSRRESASYIVATSSCDLVLGRRMSALLFPIEAKRRGDYETEPDKLKSDLGSLTLFLPKQQFFLPALADDDPDVLYNIAHLDPLAVISNENINLSERRASLTLVGWRMFGALTRGLLIREAEQEEAMRRDDRPATEEAHGTGESLGQGEAAT